jgi:translation initiation factor IF-2
MTEAEKKELSVILKGDVHGSVETILATLAKMATEEVRVTVKHSAVGGISESDVALANASEAIIIGFNVTASGKVRRAAEDSGVDIRYYDVIYDITDDIEKAIVGMLDPEHRMELLGHAEVREVFRVSKIGMVAGCYVTSGSIQRSALIRVTRDGIVIENDRKLSQLKRFKDDAKEVKSGQECGMLIDGYDDIKVGDVVECYLTHEVRPGS